MARCVPIIFATRSGGTTIDRDAQGGNPFATALIELATQPRHTRTTYAARLRQLTRLYSGKHQAADWPEPIDAETWSLLAPTRQRAARRVALVLVVSEYHGLSPPRLLGAAHDERRIAAMLARNGFSVVQGVACDRASLLAGLNDFRASARGSDEALIYSTGHGVERDGAVYLLPGDYPFAAGYSKRKLQRHALPIARIADACRARRLNLVCFAGCRTHCGPTTMRAGAVKRTRRKLGA